jgi:chemotaxis signal transduction protein
MLPLHGLSTNDLERMADDEFWNYARMYASSVPPISPDKSNHLDQHLECKLNRGTCLIPLKDVIEVLPSPQQYTHLPLVPAWLRGLCAWRGEAIPVVELDTYLNGVSTPHSHGMLVIASYNELIVGLLVPDIGRTTPVQFEQVHSFPGPTIFYTPIRAGAIKGVYAEEPVLDVSALLPDVVQQIGMSTLDG